MKKIGILTLHRAVNDGAALQLYSLCKFLEKSFEDYKVEIIDYRPIGLEIYNIKNYFTKKSPFLNISFIRKQKIHKKLLNNLNLSRKTLTTNNYRKTVKFINSLDYDIIFVGSDEVWSIRKNKYLPSPPNIYWLNNDIKAKKISFAPSANKSDLNLIKNNKEILAQQINSFDMISVRDDFTKKILIEYLDIPIKKIKKIPDPTFLMPIKDTNVKKKIFKKLKNDKKICAISIGSSKISNYIAKIMSEKGYQVVSLIIKSDYFDLNLNGKLSMFEWAESYKYFNIVITDRFHSSVFSLKNLTPFLIIDHDKIYQKIDSKTKPK